MPAERVSVAAGHPGPFTRAQARAAGFTDADVRRLLRAGEWVRLRRGIYVCAVQLARPLDRLLAEASAARLAVGERAVLSHRTAAVLHGLSTPGWPPGGSDRLVPDLTSPPELLRFRRADGFRLWSAGLPPHHVTSVRGLPVTTVARTVVDLARSLPFPDAVVLADQAMHSGADRGEMQRVLRDCMVWPGIRRAARVVPFADGRAESPLESWCRVVFHEHGLPPAEPQGLLVDERDGWWGRVDFPWEQFRTIVEADGMTKYADRDVLRQEKLRQERIEELGYVVLRVTWTQVIREPLPTVARVVRAFARGTRLRGS